MLILVTMLLNLKSLAQQKEVVYFDFNKDTSNSNSSEDLNKWLLNIENVMKNERSDGRNFSCF
jgi:hypothetical protein